MPDRKASVEEEDKGEMLYYDFTIKVYNPAITDWVDIDPTGNRIPEWSPYQLNSEGVVVSVEINSPDIEDCCPPPPGYESYEAWEFEQTDVLYDAVIGPPYGMV